MLIINEINNHFFFQYSIRTREVNYLEEKAREQKDPPETVPKDPPATVLVPQDLVTAAWPAMSCDACSSWAVWSTLKGRCSEL